MQAAENSCECKIKTLVAVENLGASPIWAETETGMAIWIFLTKVSRDRSARFTIIEIDVCCVHYYLYENGRHGLIAPRGALEKAWAI